MPATPLEELSSYKSKREAMKAFLDALYDLGGEVKAEKTRTDGGRGGTTNANTLVVKMVDEKYHPNSIDTWRKLVDGGWVEMPINGKKVPYVKMKIGLPWKNPRRPVGMNGDTPDTPTSTTEAVAPIAEVTPEPSVVPSAEGDEVDLGMRGGRLAARLEKSLPDNIAAAVIAVVKADRDAQYAALGYYPTIPQDVLDEMKSQIVKHDGEMARMQSETEEQHTLFVRAMAMLNYLQDEVDEQRRRTNEFTPASKAMSVSKVPEFYRPLAKLAVNQGWTIQNTRGGHLAWKSPEGKSAFSGSTPNPNSVGVLRIKLVRLGLKGAGGTSELPDVTQSGQLL